MIVDVSNISIPLDAFLPQGEELARESIARALGIKFDQIAAAKMLKRSVDARKKANVHFVATYAVTLPDDTVLQPIKGVRVKDHATVHPLDVPDCQAEFENEGRARPLVVGTGPAGLFAGLYLARAHMQPIVIERGAPVEERMRAVKSFSAGGALDPIANVQFGEGGAGTFSDGKLTTGTKSPHIRHVLDMLVEAGAPEEILWQAKPHIGTDKLAMVVRRLHEAIVAAGGDVLFHTQLVSLGFDKVTSSANPNASAGSGKKVASATLRDTSTGEERTVEVDRIVMACGHSARDTLSMLYQAGFAMERKPFSVGVRIEHPQSLVDRVQYGRAAGHAALPPADYKLSVHTNSGRGVYTFCMCPGGEVVAASSEEGGICTNGMSAFARDGVNANSALLVDVGVDDLPGNDVLAGISFQRELEQTAYQVGLRGAGVPYMAPAQTVGDFIAGERGHMSTLVVPSYSRGVAWSDLHECLPTFVTESMEEAFPLLDAKMRGFAHPEAVMTGVETRSSSPVRMVRDETCQARLLGAQSGLYPCGEGAGYAGGIMSAATDGLRVAEAIVAEVMASSR